MNKLPERIRIKDIASADVSVGTVDQCVACAKRYRSQPKQVEEILKQLDYQPNVCQRIYQQKYLFVCLPSTRKAITGPMWNWG